jgi:hypothetical protein
MANQLIPPPELAPPSVKHLPLEKRIELWRQLVDDCEAFMLSNLQNRAGTNGDWKAAYRDWYSRAMEDHDRAQVQFLLNLSRREAAIGK